jgi:hypothetical protein
MFVTLAIDVSLCRVNGVLRRGGDIGDSGTSRGVVRASANVNPSWSDVRREIRCDALWCDVDGVCVCVCVRLSDSVWCLLHCVSLGGVVCACVYVRVCECMHACVCVCPRVQVYE